MTRLQRAYAADLRRYDPDLGVRWSPQRKKWAITRKVMPLMRHGIPRPVRRVPRTGGGFDEVLLSHDTELALNWKHKTAVIGYVDKLNADVVEEIKRMDGWRRGNSINKRVEAIDAAQAKDEQYRKKQRVGAAYDFLKSGWRRNIMSY